MVYRKIMEMSRFLRMQVFLRLKKELPFLGQLRDFYLYLIIRRITKYASAARTPRIRTMKKIIIIT